MENETQPGKPEIKNVFFSLAIATIFILALVYLEDIIKPIIVAGLVWFIIKELKQLLGKIRIRGKSLPGFWLGFFALIVIILILVGIFEIISFNVEQISEQAPSYREKLDNVVESLSAFVNDPQIMKYVQNGISNIDFSGMIANVVTSLSSMVGNFAVIIIYVIFLLMEESMFYKKIKVLYPSKGAQYDKLVSLLSKIDQSVRMYLSSMILISLITAIVSYVALLILGVDFPVLWAFLVFILNFVPYIGPFVSSLLPAVLSVLQFGDLLHFVYVFGILEGIQVILGNFVQPKMMGKSMNISALTVLIALAFWGSLWGIEGMILAVPIASVIIIIFYQFPGTRTIAILLSEKGIFKDY